MISIKSYVYLNDAAVGNDIRVDGIHGTIGEDIEIRYQGWIVDGVIKEHSKHLGQPVTMATVRRIDTEPMPPVVNGELELPHISGHAHAKSWSKGEIVQVGDNYYKVKSASTRTGHVVYLLEPSTESAYLTRTVRISIKESSEDRAAKYIGRVLDHPSGPMLVKKIEYSTFSGALGRDRVYFGVGPLLRPDQVEKARAKDPHHIARMLGATYSAETVADCLPDGCVELWADTNSAGHNAWYRAPDGIVYYVRSEHDHAPTTWRTIATVRQVETAKKIGVNPSLA